MKSSVVLNFPDDYFVAIVANNTFIVDILVALGLEKKATRKADLGDPNKIISQNVWRV